VTRCRTCGTGERAIRSDGECFRCHIRGIGFTFQGGGFYGRENWNKGTVKEFLTNNVAPDRDGIERAR
jgi:hypothetical protein